MSHTPTATTPGAIRKLAIAALGVVFGDIGTSPLYAFRTCFDDVHGVVPTPENVLGLLSLIFWSLTAVISVKYVGIMLRADNRGEGGVLALMALVLGGRSPLPRSVVVALGVLGAALFFSDGAITPAISVLSAVEGIAVANDELGTLVVPIVVLILLGLFAMQKRGTGTVGRLFGPVMVLWFSVLALLGVLWIVREPVVLLALDPRYALEFMWVHRGEALIVLAAVFLAVTGGEALYADMGHFGARPIRLAWYFFVLPALTLNYFGQGALALSDPDAVSSPFYLLAPEWALAPLVLLATAATVIASQAVITGVFSLAHQALQLGLLPRFTIVHSSAESVGQVYVPAANRILLVATLGLVLSFGSSDALAAAYGVAIASAMLIDSVLVSILLWRGERRRERLMLVAILLAVILDLGFLMANSLKIPHGGWLPLVASASLMLLMWTWYQGSALRLNLTSRRQMPLRSLLAAVAQPGLHRVPGTAVYLEQDLGAVPRALQRVIETHRALRERIVLLTVETADEPRLKKGSRVEVKELGSGIYRMVARCGFMETPFVPGLLREAESSGLTFEPAETIYVLSTQHLLVERRSAMARWRKRLYAAMMRNEQPAARHFGLPPQRVIEFGEQLEI